MTKSEFLEKLRERISALPQSDVRERLAFYGEMIDDRIEEGLSEQEAVADIGGVEAIADQIVADTPLATLVKEKIKPKRTLKAWEIVLIVLGFPIWFSVFVTAFAVMIAFYAVIWSLIISLWAVCVSFAVALICLAALGAIFIFKGDALIGVAAIGAAFVCAGLAIFVFFGCVSATKGAVILIKKVASAVKRLFVKKEDER